MSDFVPPGLNEVWDWKKRAEEETKSMSREQLIEFYKTKADEVQRRLNLVLVATPAAGAASKLTSR